MKDCEGHENNELNPATRACKAYVALCCGAGDHHDAYMDWGDVKLAITDILGDLMHLCDEERLDFWEILGIARRMHNGELQDFMRITKQTCIEQAVEANLKPHSRAEIIAAFAYTRNITVVVAKPAVEDPTDYMGLPELE